VRVERPTQKLLDGAHALWKYVVPSGDQFACVCSSGGNGQNTKKNLYPIKLDVYLILNSVAK
jgi:hypothetical protein